MQTKSDIAVLKFEEGYNCAQAVLYSFCDVLCLEKDAALMMATGFGAGMGRKQEVCGALSGGIIAIGKRYGRSEGQDKTKTEETYGKVREFISRFESKNGSRLCRELLNGCDLDTAEGRRLYRDNGLFDKTCKNCVRTAAEILEAIL